ncbi:MAG: hypothetical protein QME05_03355 [Candidatus Margulisbacteria bacterium]|nr:hypothetical protein [Candidatus Margulisiibacteriota bacterium]
MSTISSVLGILYLSACTPTPATPAAGEKKPIWIPLVPDEVIAADLPAVDESQVTRYLDPFNRVKWDFLGLQGMSWEAVFDYFLDVPSIDRISGDGTVEQRKALLKEFILDNGGLLSDTLTPLNLPYDAKVSTVEGALYKTGSILPKMDFKITADLQPYLRPEFTAGGERKRAAAAPTPAAPPLAPVLVPTVTGHEVSPNPSHRGTEVTIVVNGANLSADTLTIEGLDIFSGTVTPRYTTAATQITITGTVKSNASFEIHTIIIKKKEDGELREIAIEVVAKKAAPPSSVEIDFGGSGATP